MTKQNAHANPAAQTGKERLRRALAGDDGGLSHDEALAQLPSYIEAERLGLPVARRFPALTAHLDTCPACAQEYAELVEMVSWQEDDPLPLPAQARTPDLWFLLPRAERLRQAVTSLARGLVETLLPPDQRRRLSFQLEPFFDRVAELGGQFRLAPALAPQPLGLSGDPSSPSGNLLTAAYLAAESLSRLLSADTWAQTPLSAETLAVVRQEAARAAQMVGLPSPQAGDFVARFVMLTQNDPSLLAHSAPIGDSGAS